MVSFRDTEEVDKDEAKKTQHTHDDVAGVHAGQEKGSLGDGHTSKISR